MTAAAHEDPSGPDSRTDILVVEDDPALRETICWALDDEGLPNRGVANGQEALDAALRSRPLLMILDWDLPVLSSEVMVERLRDAYGEVEIPILLVTGDGRAASKAARLRAGAYLRKPFELDDFIDLVQRMIAPLYPMGAIIGQRSPIHCFGPQNEVTLKGTGRPRARVGGLGRTRMVVQADQRTVWQIDPKHTLVEFAVTYLTFTTVKGHFDGVSGTIRADDADPARASVEVEIDAASLDTREARRDLHLRSPDFLDVERYPTITFVSSRVEPIDARRLQVHGNLTIRGTTRAVVLDAELKGRGRDPSGLDVIGLAAHTEFDRGDFGLTWNQTLETGGVLVGNTVAIQLEVQAIRQD